MKKKKQSTITFATTEEAASRYDRPAPSAHALPPWLRSFGKRVPEPGGFPVGTVKQCMPFLDAMTAGYMFLLPEAVQVRVEGVHIEFHWRLNANRVESHSAAQMPQELQRAGGVWKFIQPWSLRLPAGCSALYTHPLNRHDLPFRTFSGVVDDGYDSPVQFPFIWNGADGEYVIDAGTPVAQVIPFRREDWRAEELTVTDEELLRSSDRCVTRLEGYRKLFRTPKAWR